MKNTDTFFDMQKIQNLIEILEVNLHKIEALELENHYNYSKLDEFIITALITMNWKPYFNEKAILINLEGKTASYVWFFEHWGNEFTFKMSPAEFPHLKNGYRQDVIPKLSQDNTYHSWIIPLSLFEEIKNIFDFHIYPERHLNYNI